MKPGAGVMIGFNLVEEHPERNPTTLVRGTRADCQSPIHLQRDHLEVCDSLRDSTGSRCRPSVSTALASASTLWVAGTSRCSDRPARSRPTTGTLAWWTRTREGGGAGHEGHAGHVLERGSQRFSPESVYRLEQRVGCPSSPACPAGVPCPARPPTPSGRATRTPAPRRAGARAGAVSRR